MVRVWPGNNISEKLYMDETTSRFAGVQSADLRDIGKKASIVNNWNKTKNSICFWKSVQSLSHPEDILI